MTPDGLPEPPVVTVPAPVQWQFNGGRGPDGTPVCQLVLTQGQLTAALTLLPADLAKLGQQATDAARQAGTGLIVPTAPLVNGHGKVG